MKDNQQYHCRTYRFKSRVLNNPVFYSHALRIESWWSLVPEKPDVHRVGVGEVWTVTAMRYTLDGIEFEREEIKNILQRYVGILNLSYRPRFRTRLVQDWRFDTLLCAGENNLHPN